MGVGGGDRVREKKGLLRWGGRSGRMRVRENKQERGTRETN